VEISFYTPRETEIDRLVNSCLQKILKNYLLIFAIAVGCAVQAYAQFTITPTFDRSITSLSNASAIQDAINAAIAQLENTITTPYTNNVTIYFRNDKSGLGSNFSVTGDLLYSKFLADLQSNPSKSATQISALATMPTGPIAALHNNNYVTLSAANLAAIGETTMASSLVASNGGFNGYVYLNLSLMNVSRTSGQVSSKYDLQTVALHEINEVLGIGGYGTTLLEGDSVLPTTLGPLDFFRYSAAGTRSFNYTSTGGVYFSTDGGNTKLVHFNQTGNGDYGDWSTGVANQYKGNTPPQVQDAFATSFGTAAPADLAANERTAFQVVGYNLLSKAAYWKGATNSSWTDSGNWATDASGTTATSLPSATDDITFSAIGASTRGNTTLDQDFTIRSLTIADSAAVGIRSGSGGPHTLTIAGLAGTGIDVQSGAGLFSLDANLTFAGASNTVTVNNNAGAEINGVIGGGNGLIKAGTGTLNLGAVSNYTGSTKVTQGWLVTDVTGALPATTDLILGTVNSSVAGAVDLSGRKLTVNSLSTAAGNSAGAGNIITSNNGQATLTISSTTTNSTFGGLISGPLSLVKGGAGTTLTLTAANTYTGSTTITGGTLQIGTSGSAASIGGSSGVSVNGGTTLSIINAVGNTFTNKVSNDAGGIGTVVINSGNSMTLSGALTNGSAGELALTQSGAGTTILTNTNSYTGATAVNAGTLQIGDGTSGNLTGTSGVTVAGSSILAINLGSNDTFSPNINLSASSTSVRAIAVGNNKLSGVISGSGSFLQNGTGTTTLSNTNTYTGATNVSAGTLKVDGSLAAASTVTVGTAGTLGGSGTILGRATMTGNGAINFGSGGSIVGTLGIAGGNWNGQGTVNGLVTSSSGIFNLSGNLTAPAGLAVTGGTLAGTGTLKGNLTYTSSASSTFGGNIAGPASTLTVNPKSSTLTLTGASTYGGGTTISAGTLALGDGSTAGASLGSGNITVSSKGTFAVGLAAGDTLSNSVTNNGKIKDTSPTGTHTISSTIIGTGSFTKTGAGTANLTGANTYSGATTVSGGTLLVNNTTGSGTGNSAVSVTNGGTLGGDGSIARAITLNSGGVIAPGAGSLGSAGTTLSAGSLIWNGGGTLTFRLGVTADELLLSGALTKGTTGSFTLNLIDAGIALSSYTLATFASTTFAPANFTILAPTGYTASLVQTSTTLGVNLTALPHAQLPGGTLSLRASQLPVDQSDEEFTSFTAVAAPEPGSAALLMLGAGTFLGRRRRRQA
jgi:autotransporter-associated beta strand protein